MKYSPGADVCRPIALLSRSLSTAISTSSSNCVESYDDDAPGFRNKNKLYFQRKLMSVCQTTIVPVLR